VNVLDKWLPRDKITREWRWGLPLVAAIIALDQIAKAMVAGEPRFAAMACLAGTSPCGGVMLIPPVFNDHPLFSLSMTWNHGVSFGALQAEGLARWALFGLTSLIAVGFTVWLLRAERWMTALSLSLVIGGAVGNLVDRARFGAVVDFLDFSGLYFPWIFNVADAAITIGAAFLLLDQLLASRKPQG
jgi:signal peptidase II